MYHYTYLLEFQDGMKYIGAHSTPISPELDVRYLGSGRRLPARSLDTCIKTILATYPNRAEALAAELDYINQFDCCASEAYYNVRKVTTDLHGRTVDTHEGVARMAEKLRGRKAGPMPIHAATRLTGEDRTQAQKAGAQRMRQALTGTKNPAKGRKGITNGGFAPWYYITPQGVYTEVRDETKQQFALRHQQDPQSVVNRCRKGVAHVKAIKGKWKGWVFGDLEA